MEMFWGNGEGEVLKVEAAVAMREISAAVYEVVVNCISALKLN